jgi:predicted lipoprotein with Yx(FWY)xxD motif
MRKSGWAAAAGLVSAALLLTACGGSSNGASGTSTPTTSAAATNTASSPAANPSASGNQSSPPPGTVYFSVQRSSKGYILAEAGVPVYTYTGDTKGKAATCTGSCATTWKPVEAQNPQKSPADHLPGTLSEINGQATYNGLPLYTYAPASNNIEVYPSSQWHLVSMSASDVIGG